MLPQPIVLGHHGCSRAWQGEWLMAIIPLRQSRNDYDWLGHGIYFWAGDPARALVWARKRAEELGQAVSEAGILGAAIDLGNCLQLGDARAAEYLREAYYQDVRQVSELEGVPLPTNTGRFFSNRKLDCAVFESLHNLRAKRDLVPFDTVAAYFIEGTEIYPGAAIRALDHVQICVRNPANIVGYFLPRDS